MITNVTTTNKTVESIASDPVLGTGFFNITDQKPVPTGENGPQINYKNGQGVTFVETINETIKNALKNESSSKGV